MHDDLRLRRRLGAVFVVAGLVLGLRLLADPPPTPSTPIICCKRTSTP